MNYYKHKSSDVFERRLMIVSFIAKSKKPVSNIDLQLKFGFSKEVLNKYLNSLVDFGYLDYTKKSNAFLYFTTGLANGVFKND